MRIEEFARITRNVIVDEGLDGHVPTATYPARRHIAVLEGVPPGVDLEPVALEWAATTAVGDEEFLVVFRVTVTTFKIVRRYRGALEEAVFDAPARTGSR